MNIEALKSFVIPETTQAYGWKDVALYALSLGYGSDPLDEPQLGFVYEKGLKVVPSFCNVLSHPGFWLDRRELGIDWAKVLHGEQAYEIHAPLPVTGAVVGAYEIRSVEDKGAAKGAVVQLVKTLRDASDNRVLATVTSAIFLRGDGGSGGFGSPSPSPAPMPDGDPDIVLDTQTSPQMALLYRLNGDVNPLHADPKVATYAGFRQPILHGLGAMGIATRAVLQAICGNDSDRLQSMSLRFSSPMYPGETVRTEIFRTPAGARFRCRVVERDIVVLDRGSVTVTA